MKILARKLKPKTRLLGSWSRISGEKPGAPGSCTNVTSSVSVFRWSLTRGSEAI